MPRRSAVDAAWRACVAESGDFGAATARYRLSAPAKADIAAIPRRSEELHGGEARIRYRACLTVAMRRVAADPGGRSTLGRSALVPGIRSFYIRHSRTESREAPVANPVHVIFYRVINPGVVEIVRVLHDRMEPRRHIGPEAEAESDERRGMD